MARSRVELFEQIRRDRRGDEGLSIRELAERHGCSPAHGAPGAGFAPAAAA
jgi:hypothetical protein